MQNPDQTYNSEINNESSVPWKISDVIFVYFCIFILSMIFAGAMLYVSLDIDKNIYFTIFQSLLSISILALVYIIVTKKYNTSFKEAFGISFKKMPLFINQGIIATAVIIISTTVISLFFLKIVGVESQNPYTEMPEIKFRWFSLLAVLFAPIVEEIFFRGFMQPAIIKRTGTFVGIAVTALIFGISHVQYIDYSTAIFSVTAIGLILGITRHLTSSVMPGIFAHFFNNLLAVIAILT